MKYFTHEFLDTMRQTGDPLADKAVESVMESGNRKQVGQLFESMQRNDFAIDDSYPEPLQHFLAAGRTLPEWHNENQMAKGAEFYARHAFDIQLMLSVVSLPTDYAAAKGAEVIYRTGRLLKDVGQRLAETGQFISDVTARKGFSRRGKAISSILKVRLVHALTRYSVSRRKDWDAQTLGVPVNQEDMAGTHYSFCLMPIRSMRRLNVSVSYEEQQAYNHLWNVISYMGGIDERLLAASGKEAHTITRLIGERHYEPSEAGQALMHALLGFYRNFSQQIPVEVMIALMYELQEPGIPAVLGLPEPRERDRLFVRTFRGVNSIRNALGYQAQNQYQLTKNLNQVNRRLNVKKLKGQYTVPSR